MPKAKSINKTNKPSAGSNEAHGNIVGRVAASVEAPHNTQGPVAASSVEAPSPSTSTATAPNSWLAGEQVWQVVQRKKTPSDMRKKNKRTESLSNIGGKILLDTTVNNPRTCIYVPKSIDAVIINEFCSRDLTTVRLRSSCPSIPEVILASAYLPGDADVPTVELVNLIRHCEDKKLELIISADANAHHTIWGGGASNKRDWQVSNELSNSDHRWIRYKLNVDTKKPEPWRNPRRTDSVWFGKLVSASPNLKHIPEEYGGPADIEKHVNKLTETLIDAFQKSCPLTGHTPRTANRSGWWSPQLEKLRCKLRKLFNRAKNTRKAEDWDAYKATQAAYKKCIRVRKRECWRTFCTNIKSNTQAARVRKILSKDPDRNLGSLKKPDNSYTTTDTEMCELLLNTHFPGCSVTENTTWEEEFNKNLN
ncbi:uncharacterized protein LOC119188592 [Manduca sexta]|uniref:uncharacterized protein LOC119188592 n=1 Tax=Manduca sexta TaxID=7130 RepID=UPI00188ED289|nr:uncharacterized protein LOC119188592 [Manduca sexta]